MSVGCFEGTAVTVTATALLNAMPVRSSSASAAIMTLWAILNRWRIRCASFSFQPRNKTILFQIKLCGNKLETQQDTNLTLTHELIHAFDNCRAYVDWTKTDHHACRPFYSNHLLAGYVLMAVKFEQPTSVVIASGCKSS